MRYVTYCALRLGDNLAHAHFLRKLSISHPEDRFVHYLHARYAFEIRNVVADQTNIEIRVLSQKESVWWNEKPIEPAVNAWKNAKGFWEHHEYRFLYVPFMLSWFKALAAKMGIESPFEKAEDLLFDYPRLKLQILTDRMDHVLVVNSQPMSGQCRNYSIDEMDELVIEVSEKFEKVYVTEPREAFIRRPNIRPTAVNNLNVTDVGKLSQMCDILILVATGPSWTCFNVWNANNPPRFLAIVDDPDRVDLLRQTHHARGAEDVRTYLRRANIL